MLGELFAAVPAGLSELRQATLQCQVRERCNDLLDAGLLVLQQRNMAQYRFILADAERTAFAGFKAAAERRVPSGSTDVDDASSKLKVRQYSGVWVLACPLCLMPASQ